MKLEGYWKAIDLLVGWQVKLGRFGAILELKSGKLMGIGNLYAASS